MEHETGQNNDENMDVGKSASAAVENNDSEEKGKQYDSKPGPSGSSESKMCLPGQYSRSGEILEAVPGTLCLGMDFDISDINDGMKFMKIRKHKIDITEESSSSCDDDVEEEDVSSSCDEDDEDDEEEDSTSSSDEDSENNGPPSKVPRMSTSSIR